MSEDLAIAVSPFSDFLISFDPLEVLASSVDSELPLVPSVLPFLPRWSVL